MDFPWNKQLLGHQMVPAFIWLVVSTPLNIMSSSVAIIIPNKRKNRIHVPNHQAVIVYDWQLIPIGNYICDESNCHPSRLVFTLLPGLSSLILMAKDRFRHKYLDEKVPSGGPLRRKGLQKIYNKERALMKRFELLCFDLLCMVLSYIVYA